MIQALIPQLIPILGSVLDKTITDKNARQKVIENIESALVANAHTLNLETIKTNQIEAGHRSIWVAGWRPAIGWSCAAGIFWMVVGYPVMSWVTAFQNLDVALPNLPTDILFELTMAMLGMGALRSFDKLKNLTK